MLDHRSKRDRAVACGCNPDSFPCQGGEEAAVLACMAGRPARLDPVEERVPVAVQLDLDDPLGVATRRALAPELGARAGIVMGLAAGERLLQSLAVGVGQRKHVARRLILGDDGDEAVLVELHHVWTRDHRSIPSVLYLVPQAGPGCRPASCAL